MTMEQDKEGQITSCKIDLIVATDMKSGISKNNKIPWSIREDYKHFSDTTTKTYVENKINAVIMGKNTWLTLPVKGLKNRLNVIVSSTLTQNDIQNAVAETYIAKTLKEAIKLCSNVGRIFICGGKSIYDEALESNMLSDLYITTINHNYNCDNFINLTPQILSNYVISSKKTLQLNDRNTGTQFVTFTKYSKNK